MQEETNNSGLESTIKNLRTDFPNLRFELRNDAICVDVQGYWPVIASQMSDGIWVINEDVKAALPNYVVFKKLEDELMVKDASFNRGAYLVINSPTSRIFTETFDSAWGLKSSPHAFIGRIGFEKSNEDVLMLADVQKPEGFDRINERYETLSYILSRITCIMPSKLNHFLGLSNMYFPLMREYILTELEDGSVFL